MGNCGFMSVLYTFLEIATCFSKVSGVGKRAKSGAFRRLFLVFLFRRKAVAVQNLGPLLFT